MHVLAGACGGQKKVLELLELEKQRAQQLEALPLKRTWVLMSPNSQLTIARSWSFKGADALIWPLWTPMCTQAHMNTYK